jgi:hypothetical protein
MVDKAVKAGNLLCIFHSQSIFLYGAHKNCQYIANMTRNNLG